MKAVATLARPMSDALAHGKGRAEFLSLGAATRRLFGIFHASTPMARSVLVCPPFGQEAMRLHRLLRVLAERLARQRVATLRFDYFGTGDSDGDDAEADFDGWVSDILVAHQELVDRTSGAPVTWLGLGLGGSLAVTAASELATPPAKLILWEPVLDGQAYLQTLRRRHLETIEYAFSLPNPAWRRAFNNDPSAFTDEAMGFAVPEGLREGIRRLTLEGLGSHLTSAIDVVADPANTIARDWSLRLARSRRAVFHPMASQFDWTAEQLSGSALVPAEALKLLIAACTEG